MWRFDGAGGYEWTFDMTDSDDWVRFPNEGIRANRDRRRRSVRQQNLLAVMNNTRWRKLRALLDLRPAVAYRIMNVEMAI